MSKCDFNKVALRHGCSPVNLLHIFRTLFLKNTSGRLLLSVAKVLNTPVLTIIQYYIIMNIDSVSINILLSQTKPMSIVLTQRKSKSKNLMEIYAW